MVRWNSGEGLALGLGDRCQVSECWPPDPKVLAGPPECGPQKHKIMIQRIWKMLSQRKMSVTVIAHGGRGKCSLLVPGQPTLHTEIRSQNKQTNKPWIVYS